MTPSSPSSTSTLVTRFSAITLTDPVPPQVYTDEPLAQFALFMDSVQNLGPLKASMRQVITFLLNEVEGERVTKLELVGEGLGDISSDLELISALGATFSSKKLDLLSKNVLIRPEELTVRFCLPQSDNTTRHLLTCKLFQKSSEKYAGAKMIPIFGSHNYSGFGFHISHECHEQKVCFIFQNSEETDAQSSLTLPLELFSRQNFDWQDLPIERLYSFRRMACRLDQNEIVPEFLRSSFLFESTQDVLKEFSKAIKASSGVVRSLILYGMKQILITHELPIPIWIETGDVLTTSIDGLWIEFLLQTPKFCSVGHELLMRPTTPRELQKKYVRDPKFTLSLIEKVQDLLSNDEFESIVCGPHKEAVIFKLISGPNGRQHAKCIELDPHTTFAAYKRLMPESAKKLHGLFKAAGMPFIELLVRDGDENGVVALSYHTEQLPLEPPTEQFFLLWATYFRNSISVKGCLIPYEKILRLAVLSIPKTDSWDENLVVCIQGATSNISEDKISLEMTTLIFHPMTTEIASDFVQKALQVSMEGTLTKGALTTVRSRLLTFLTVHREQNRADVVYGAIRFYQEHCKTPPLEKTAKEHFVWACLTLSSRESIASYMTNVESEQMNPNVSTKSQVRLFVLACTDPEFVLSDKQKAHFDKLRDMLSVDDRAEIYLEIESVFAESMKYLKVGLAPKIHQKSQVPKQPQINLRDLKGDSRIFAHLTTAVQWKGAFKVFEGKFDSESLGKGVEILVNAKSKLSQKDQKELYIYILERPIFFGSKRCACILTEQNQVIQILGEKFSDLAFREQVCHLMLSSMFTFYTTHRAHLHAWFATWSKGLNIQPTLALKFLSRIDGSETAEEVRFLINTIQPHLKTLFVPQNIVSAARPRSPKPPKVTLSPLRPFFQYAKRVPEVFQPLLIALILDLQSFESVDSDLFLIKELYNCSMFEVKKALIPSLMHCLKLKSRHEEIYALAKELITLEDLPFIMTLSQFFMIAPDENPSYTEPKNTTQARLNVMTALVHDHAELAEALPTYPTQLKMCLESHDPKLIQQALENHTSLLVHYNERTVQDLCGSGIDPQSQWFVLFFAHFREWSTLTQNIFKHFIHNFLANHVVSKIYNPTKLDLFAIRSQTYTIKPYFPLTRKSYQHALGASSAEMPFYVPFPEFRQLRKQELPCEREFFTLINLFVVEAMKQIAKDENSAVLDFVVQNLRNWIECQPTDTRLLARLEQFIRLIAPTSQLFLHHQKIVPALVHQAILAGCVLKDSEHLVRWSAMLGIESSQIMQGELLEELKEIEREFDAIDCTQSQEGIEVPLHDLMLRFLQWQEFSCFSSSGKRISCLKKLCSILVRFDSAFENEDIQRTLWDILAPNARVFGSNWEIDGQSAAIEAVTCVIDSLLEACKKSIPLVLTNNDRTTLEPNPDTPEGWDLKIYSKGEASGIQFLQTAVDFLQRAVDRNLYVTKYEDFQANARKVMKVMSDLQVESLACVCKEFTLLIGKSAADYLDINPQLTFMHGWITTFAKRNMIPKIVLSQVARAFESVNIIQYFTERNYILLNEILLAFGPLSNELTADLACQGAKLGFLRDSKCEDATLDFQKRLSPSFKNFLRQLLTQLKKNQFSP